MDRAERTPGRAAMMAHEKYRRAIPTVYNGVRFRSRMEAKWARFFDLLGWRWEYEPFDLPGWIPDFALLGKRPILVEVKPVFEFPREVADEIDKAYPGNEGPALDTLDKEVLIVGAAFCKSDFDLGPGWLREGTWWETATFGRWTDVWGFCHSFGSYNDRITGEYSGNCGLAVGEPEELLELWRRAGNSVQWQKAVQP